MGKAVVRTASCTDRGREGMQQGRAVSVVPGCALSMLRLARQASKPTRGPLGSERPPHGRQAWGLLTVTCRAAALGTLFHCRWDWSRGFRNLNTTLSPFLCLGLTLAPSLFVSSCSSLHLLLN